MKAKTHTALGWALGKLLHSCVSLLQNLMHTCIRDAKLPFPRLPALSLTAELETCPC